MDVDDFLDRELEGKQTQPAQQQQPIQQIDVVSDKEDLWRQLLQRQFSWDEQMHNELNGYLNKLNSDYMESMRRSQQSLLSLKERIAQIRAMVRTQQFKQAQESYDQAFASLEAIDDLNEQKVPLAKDLYSLQYELRAAMAASTRSRSRSVAEQLVRIISAAIGALRSRQLSSAQRLYLQAMQLFLSEKLDTQTEIAMGRKLVSLYKQVSIQGMIAQLEAQLGASNVPFPVVAQQVHRQKILSGLLSQKLNRAQEHIKKGFPAEAKRELEMLLRLDPKNEQAKKMLEKMPQ